MNYTDIIDIELKSEFINDLFETYDVDVTYVYDRTYENIEDEYRAEIFDLGLEFVFNKYQKLTVLFLNQTEHTGHNPFEGEDPRCSPLNTASKAIKYAQDYSIEYEHRAVQENSMLGHKTEWVKLFYENYFIHYSFVESGLEKVTIQSRQA